MSGTLLQPQTNLFSKNKSNIDLRIEKKEFDIHTEDCACVIDEVEFVKIIDLKTNMSLPVVDTPQPTTTATPRKGMPKFLSRLFNRMAVLPLTLPLCLVLLLGVGNVWGQTTNLVISQIYGGGGNASATHRNDFVEIYNPTGSSVSLTGWSVQYAATTSTSTTIAAGAIASLSGSIPAGRYYLISMSSGGAVGTLLPTADLTASGINMAAGNGKVWLCNSTTALTLNSSGCPNSTTNVIDFVGYGTANCYEGSAAASGPSANITSVYRNFEGCQDGNNNSLDFTTPTPNPRNSSTAANTCITFPTAQTLPYTQNFGTTAFTSYPTGWAGFGGIYGTTNSQSSALATKFYANATIGTPAAYTGNSFSAEPSGGLYGFVTSSNGRLAVATSNASNGNALNQPLLAINTGSGVTSITFDYDITVLYTTATNRSAGIELEYRQGNSGSWTSVSGSSISYTVNSNPSGTTSKSLTISGLTASTVYQFRWASWRDHASGSTNLSLGLDNISITPVYKVTFDGNSSTSGSMSSQSASSATNLTSNSFSRTGYTFGGWATSSGSATVAYANGASYPFDASITLYAIWTANTLTVTYNSQGGSAISNGSTTTGGTVSDPGTPTKSGYTFNGWFAASSGGSAISFPYTHGQTDGFTLYAQWTANTLTVSYDSQGGSAISNGSTTTGGSVSNPGNPTLNGYTFIGWFVASTGGSAISFPYTHGQTAGFTLYAQWIVASSPAISGAATASAFTTTYGTASAPQSFSISGSALSADIIATAPTGFEVSSDGTTYGSTATFTQSSGSVSGSLYIRLAATAPVSGTYNGQNIVLSSTGAASVNITSASSGNAVAQKALAITTATVASKVYDRSTASGTVTSGALSGFVGSETVVVSSAVGTYADWNVGTGKTATISYTLGNGTNGGLAANYSLANTITTGNITAKALTVSSPAVSTKTYDGNTSATITGSLSGVISPDAVILVGTGTFATTNVGTGISVTSTSTLGGADAGNYSLTQPTGLSGNITGATQTITFASLTPATLSTADYSPGATASSGLTVTYTSSNPCVANIIAGNIHIVGAGATTITASQSGGGNYSAATSVDQTLVVQSASNPTSTLTAGDLAFIQYDSDNPDKFTFMPLVDLAEGTVINFTDNGFASATTGTTTEGFLTYTVPTGGHASGTVLTWYNGMTIAGTGWSSAAPNAFAFNSGGDQLFAFQGSTSNWSTQSSITLIAGVNQNATPWITTGSAAASTSYQPSGLSSSYIVLFGNDNAYFANNTTTATSVTLTDNKAGLQSILFNGTNKWYKNSTGPLAVPTYSFTVSASSLISSSGTLSAVNTTYGTASASPTSFSVSASSLTADLTLTPPSGFEISSGSGYSTSLTISPNACGAIAATTIYVRLAATTAVGSYAGNIVLSSTGATSVNVATVSSSVSAKSLTITNLTASDKIYDGLTTVTVSGTPAYSGLVNSESFSVSGSVNWAFPNATVGNNKILSRTGNYSAPSANYSVTQPSLTASITTRSLTITANDVSKPYGATLTGASGSTAFSSNGLQNSETISSVTIAYGSGAASTDAAGTYTGQVTPSAATGGTFTASNYSITYASGTITISDASTLDAVILFSPLTTTYGTASTGVSFVGTGSNLVDNITATAQSGYEVSSDNSSFGSSVTVPSGTTVYVRFTATLAVGTYNNAIAAVLTSSGAADVNVTTSSSGNTVSAKALTISGISISNKIYDGNTTATITGTAAYSGLVNGEPFTVSGTPSATFSDKNVGTNKTITVIGYTSPSSNYTFSQPSGLLANITSKSLTVTSAAVTTKTYDGTTAATITGTLSGVISPDVVTLVGTGTFASANVGTGISVTSIATLGGAGAGNYSLTQPTGLSGEITLKSLTIMATDVSKEMGVLLTGGAGSTAFTSTGLAGSETIGSVSITYGAAAGTTGQGATAGTYSGQVTPSAATGGTFNAANYSITYSSGSITVSGFTAGNIVVERIGNGSTTLTSAASAINVIELNTSGTTQQTLSTLFTGSNLLTESGTGTSNGNLNSYNTLLGVPGYNSALGTASVNSSNTKATNILGTGATVVNRVVFPTSGIPLPFNGDNFRSVIPISSSTFYASGTSSGSGAPNGGIWYYNGTSFTQVCTTITNSRNVDVFNGNLYFSTGSGSTRGVYKVGSGLPTSSAQTATSEIDMGSAASPYGFVLSPDGNTMYVADDRASSSGGIYKFTKSGGTWSPAYSLGTGAANIGARGLMVDFSGENPIIYATSAETSANRIIKITDAGSTSTSTTIATAGTNYVFRGVDFAPAAAPSAPTIGTLTQTTCASTTGSVELTGLPSGQWRIYGFPSGSAVGTGSSTTISDLAAGTYTFIVTSYTGRTSVASASATINTQPGAPGYPTAPTAASQSFCTSASPTVGDLTVTTGSSIKWYDASTNGNLVASETALTSGNYYASQTVSGCESATRTSVAVTINSSGTWIGDSNDDWNIAGNWCGGVPNSSLAVVSVPTGVVLNLDTSPSVLNLTIGSGATINAGTYTINIADGGSITNNGTFNAQTGELVFTGAGTISGTSAMSINNLTLNGALTINTSPTADGIIQLNNGSSVLNGSINYTVNAYLYYNQSGTVSSSSFEWPTNNGPNKVAIYNGTNLSLNENKSLNTNLSLANGRLILGDNHLTLGETATVTGTFSSANMIIATGLGELRKRFAQGSGDIASFTFPVGNSGGVSEYTPIVLDFASGSYGANAYVGVRVQDSKQATLNSSVTNYLNRNWIVEPNDITGYSYKIHLHYVDADFVTDGSMAEGDLKPIKISSGQWYQPTDGSFTNAVSQGSAGVFANSNYLEWNGLTTFSEFGGAGGSNQPLPVELLSFSAECANESIILKWQTASEYNSSHFDVEKSTDGLNWNTIGQLPAAGNSNELLSYSLEDASKRTNTSYYRLNQVDIDGLQKYYGPISPMCETINHLNGKTIPNPSNNEFWLQISSAEQQKITYVLQDINGTKILENTVELLPGSNMFPIRETIPSGMYFILLQTEKGQQQVIKHIRN